MSQVARNVTLSNVEYESVIQTESGARFDLPLQNVFWLLVVKHVDLFNVSLKIVSAGSFTVTADHPR